MWTFILCGLVLSYDMVVKEVDLCFVDFGVGSRKACLCHSAAIVSVISRLHCSLDLCVNF